MNQATRSQRLHIAIFGRRNVGKSSLINALTNQDIALVSDVPGTTADPVNKAMEILPIGPVLFIDTAGIDDCGELGGLRVKKTFGVIDRTDLAIIVTDSLLGEYELKFIEILKDKGTNFIVVQNKADVNKPLTIIDYPFIAVSATKKEGIEELKHLIVENKPSDYKKETIVGDIISKGDIVILNCPIDASAPQGRLILPQVNTIRDIIDHDGKALVVQTGKITEALKDLNKKPTLVITDSQAFKEAAAATPSDIPFTSFSILFAKYLGLLDDLVSGVAHVEKLCRGDRILIAEACTHHRTGDDIGRVKIPRWLEETTGLNFKYEWSSGYNLPENLSKFSLVIHCGGCMINRREMVSRIKKARKAGVPITNYGIFIAYRHGLLSRALKPLGIKS